MILREGMQHRNSSQHKTVFLFLLPLMFMVFLGFAQLNQVKSQRIKIVTTVFPLMEFAKAVCGEKGEVYLLLPPGAEVHTWRPRPSDIVRLSSVDLFIYIGSNLEPWVHDLLESVKRSGLHILEASQNLPSHVSSEPPSHRGEPQESGKHEGHEEMDPHIWLDFELDQIIVDKIASHVSEMNPDFATVFKKNARAYKQRLQSLHQKYRIGLKNCQNKTLILGGHSAFGYLARQYNLHQISLYGLSPDSRPTPRTLVEVVEMAKKLSIEFIFFETYVSDDLAKVLAKEVGARTLVLNPGANLTKEELDSRMSFFDIMDKNLENLRHALGCR